MTDQTTQSPFSTTSVLVQASSLAIVSLVSGIACWFVLPFLGAVIAVITGHMAKKEIRESAGRLSGVEMANAGLFLGYVHLALSVLTACLVLTICVAVFFLAVSTAGWSSSYIHVGF